MNVFGFSSGGTVAALWFGFGFSIVLGGVIGFVMKLLFDFTVRHFPKNNFLKNWRGGE